MELSILSGTRIRQILSQNIFLIKNHMFNVKMVFFNIFIVTRCTKTTTWVPRITLRMRPANERRRYIVNSSLIGWAHTQNDPRSPIGFYTLSIAKQITTNHISWDMLFVYPLYVDNTVRPSQRHGISNNHSTVCSTFCLRLAQREHQR